MSAATVERGARLRDGRYEIDRELGRGGAASVWLARDTLLERPVAIKVPSPALAGDPAWLARFRREARLAAGLQHPNLVSVYDFNADADCPYLVMAYLPGGSLAQRLADGDPPDAERLALDLLAALEHIHAAGIVHRDVKPANVLLAPDGRACLTDFGVARPEDATSITQTGQIPGTRRYMAPELWRGEPASERSDLYSCGVLLSQCAGEDAPARLRELIERLCAEDPERRPDSATQGLRMLDARGADAVALPPAPVPAEPTPPTAVSPSRGARRSPRVLAAAAIALAAVAGAAAIVISDDGDGGGADRDRGERRADASEQREGAAGAGATSPAGTRGEQAYDPARGAALNDEGFALMGQGRYAEAVPILQQAVDSFPPGTDDLNYAYALFNLGKSLRLAGRPEEAIPVLEERLEIPNQTGVVQAELDAAYADAGETAGGEGKPGKAKGKNKD